MEGQAGTDTLRFNGAGVAERIDLSANGNRLRFLRDIANITMDTNDVETVAFNALGGADTITVNDLAGTDVTKVRLDLAGAPGGGDGAPTASSSTAPAATTRSPCREATARPTVTGLAATVSIGNAEPANDTLAINALAGNDVVDASALQASAIKLALDGGAGNDALTGGAGNDTCRGDGDECSTGARASTSSTAARATTS